MCNVRGWDRFLRALLGIVLLEVAFFWVGGVFSLGCYIAGGVMLATALAGFCPVYRLTGMKAVKCELVSRKLAAVAVVLLVLVAVSGAYASNFFSRKIFIEDFNAMNGFYKQTLFLTGQNKRESAIGNYEKLIPAYQAFSSKYSKYRPLALKSDSQLDADLPAVGKMIDDVGQLVKTGDLHEAHLALEKIRPVFQDMFKRNGFSMLAVNLVDFHDAMELLLDAAASKDAKKLIELFPQADERLKAVETEANDPEIQAIRRNLDALLALAREDRKEELQKQADVLKSSFVKVYLVRG